MSVVEPYLDIPLRGVQLIEASAGTGKTYTLATLVLRLVVEERLRVSQILAVTYTVAATQELRKRIRERLQLALDVCGIEDAPEDSPESGLTRQILRRHLQRQEEDVQPALRETREMLQQRLREAVLETDLAAIFTIHGFCARVLGEHALEAGGTFVAQDLLTSERDLHARLAADLWRARAVDPDAAQDLVELWKTHAALADDLKHLLKPIPLLPDAPTDDIDTTAAQQDVARATEALRQYWCDHGDRFFEVLAQATVEGILNMGQYKLDWQADLRGWFVQFAAGHNTIDKPHGKLAKITPDALEKGTKAAFKGKTPDAPLTQAVDSYLAALQARESVIIQRRIQRLHSLRAEARVRAAQIKQVQRTQTYDDLITGVADALAGDQGSTLAQSLRGQYRVALVDEFQDTDTRQWQIFNQIFGFESVDPALFLIGDPKQAIYGFRGGDVQAYLAAAGLPDVSKAPELTRNFRSRPSLIRAVNALYAGKEETAFCEAGIQYRIVEVGDQRSDSDFQIDGKPAPALTLWQSGHDSPTDGRGAGPKDWDAEGSRAQATAACAAAIHTVLAQAVDGRARIEGKPVVPGDIAVLVRSHKDATRIRQALVQLGIPAVAAGKLSIFATDEARELHTVLLALLHAGEGGRLRAALATVLVGVSATEIDRLEQDGALHLNWQQSLQAWRLRLQRGGPLAMISELCAQQATRLLGFMDGERRLSNYLQLAEALQEAQALASGLQGLVAWLALRIAESDKDDDSQLLRLESDAQRVQIVTLHKSKGLEYPLVFLPFVGIGRKPPSFGRCCEVHDEMNGARCLHWKFDSTDAAWEAVKEKAEQAELAEEARLLYVGLTRARHALWLAFGPFFNHGKTALNRLLDDPQALVECEDIVLDATVAPNDLPHLALEVGQDVAPARSASVLTHGDWWVHSFSQLRDSKGGGEHGATPFETGGGKDESDEPDGMADSSDSDRRFTGTRFGVALHAMFEKTTFSAWCAWHDGESAPADQHAFLVDALLQQGYPAAEVADGVTLATRLVGHTLTARLPEQLRLCDLPLESYRAEIEFQFSIRPTDVDALLALLHAHGIVPDRDRFGLRTRLEGLMTGFIDLVYVHAGQWYVLDYKSNRLPSYDATSLRLAMRDGEYDLQALIYTLALHRWLRFRLGRGYDPARDLGGIRYVFCRGVHAEDADGAGIHAQCFDPLLVLALDTLFGPAPIQEVAA